MGLIDDLLGIVGCGSEFAQKYCECCNAPCYYISYNGWLCSRCRLLDGFNEEAILLRQNGRLSKEEFIQIREEQIKERINTLNQEANKLKDKYLKEDLK